MVFAAINSDLPPDGAFDICRWLCFKAAVAYAHGLPWDIYIVPTDGSTKSHRLTRLDEDESYGTWLDTSNLAVMGSAGLYKVGVYEAGKATGSPVKMHEGARQGRLTRHAP